mgnify:CR=1 FL=1
MALTNVDIKNAKPRERKKGVDSNIFSMKINSFSKNSSCRGHSLIMYFSCWLRNMKSTNKTLLVEKPKHVMLKQVLTPRIPISRRISF